MTIENPITNEDVAAIHEGLEDAKAGRLTPLAQAKQELQARFEDMKKSRRGQ